MTGSVVPTGYAPGSVIVETIGERDDDTGREAAWLVRDGSSDRDAFVGSVLSALRGRVRVIVDLRNRHDALR